jgi:hypothetical protein
MANTMIDQVARALYESWNNVPACTVSKSWEDLQDALPGQADWFRKMARVAIGAMREPAPVMIQLAEGHMDFILPDACGPNTPEGRYEELLCGWKTAISVALGEYPRGHANGQLAQTKED